MPDTSSNVTATLAKHDFIRGHCGLSGNKYRWIVQAIPRLRRQSTVGTRLDILLTLPGIRIPTGIRVPRQFIKFKENVL